MAYSLKPIGEETANKEIILSERSTYFGSTAAAHVRLSHELDLAEPCAKIWIEGDSCLIQNLTKFPEIVTYNKLPVYSVVGLENGDQLQVIHDRFLISEKVDRPVRQRKVETPKKKKNKKGDTVRNLTALIETMSLKESEPETPAKSEASTDLRQPSSPTTPSSNEKEGKEGEEKQTQNFETSFKSISIGPVVCQHLPVDSNWPEEEFLKQVCASQRTILFADFRRAKAAKSVDDFALDDVNKLAQDEVRAVSSLHAMCEVVCGLKLRVYEVLKDFDAVVWAVTKSDFDECIRQAEPVFPWLSRPSTLGETLLNGSAEFSEKILAPFSAIILRPGPNQGWVVYTKQGFDPKTLL